MPRPFLIFSQSDYLIQIVDINSRIEWQTVQIKISWLLQPADLDLHCLQRQDISEFSRTRVKLMYNLYEYTKCIRTDMSKLPWVILQNAEPTSHYSNCHCMDRIVRKRTFWHVRSMKTQIRLRTAQSSLSAWKNFALLAIRNAPSECAGWSESSLGHISEVDVEVRTSDVEVQMKTLIKHETIWAVIEEDNHASMTRNNKN